MRLFSAILLACLSAATCGPVWAAESTSPQKHQRSVRFLLHEQKRFHVSAGEQHRIPLTIELSREPSDPDHILLILERTFPGHLVVPMAPMAASGIWQATVLLDPVSQLQTAGKPHGYVIDASFARMEGTKLNRFMKRSVYIALGTAEDLCSAYQPEKRSPRNTVAGIFTPDDVEAADPVVQDDPINETHLAGVRAPEGGAAYWWGIKQRIAERWKDQHKRYRIRSHTKTAPQVQFRLYANGMAQTAYLEQSSGYSRVDRAALASVVDSQPFPPFPANIGRCYLDVRIDLNTAR